LTILFYFKEDSQKKDIIETRLEKVYNTRQKR
jgi:hypothetical protein